MDPIQIALKSLAAALEVQGNFSAGADGTAQEKRENDLKTTHKQTMHRLKKRQEQADKLYKRADDLEKQNKKKSKYNKKGMEAQRLRQKANAKMHSAKIRHEKAMIKHQKEQMDRFKDSVDDVVASASSYVKGFFSFKSALGLLTTAAVQGGNDLRKQMKYNVIATSGLFNQLEQAARLGVDPELLSEMQGATRATVIAMGGAAKWSDELAHANRGLYTYIGDLDETVRFTTDALHTMRLAGIEPTIDALVDTEGQITGIGKTFRDISVMGGQTFQEVNEMMRGFITSEEVKVRLSGVNKDQRRGILKEIALRQEGLIAMGFLKDQAEKAGHALDKIAGKDALDRIKSAAKLQAMGGVLGMGPQAAQAAATIRKGDRATAKEKLQAAKTISDMTKIMAQSRYGDPKRELAFQQASKKLDFAAISEHFGNALGETFGPGTALAKDQKTQGEAQADVVSLTYNISKTLKFIKDNPLGKLGAGIIAGIGWIATSAAGIFSLLLARSGLGMMGGKGGKMKGMLSGKVGGMMSRGIAGGVASYAANQALDSAWQPTSQAGVEGKGAMSGAITGAGIGMIAGPWGAAIGAAIGGLWGFTDAVLDAESSIANKNLKQKDIEKKMLIQAIQDRKDLSNEQKKIMIAAEDNKFKVAKELAHESKIATIKKWGKAGWDHTSGEMMEITGKNERQLLKLALHAQRIKTGAPVTSKMRSSLAEYASKPGTELESSDAKRLYAIMAKILESPNMSDEAIREKVNLERLNTTLDKIAKMPAEEQALYKKLAADKDISDNDATLWFNRRVGHGPHFVAG